MHPSHLAVLLLDHDQGRRQVYLRALETNQLSSTDDASKLHGRNFGSQRVFPGGPTLRSICSADATQRTPAWRTPEECLDLVGTLPRQMAAHNQNNCRPSQQGGGLHIIYIDAEGQGGVGAVLVHSPSQEVTFCKGMIPNRLVKRLERRRTQINLFELLAVWAAIRTFQHWLRGRSIVLFIDNQSALNMCIKGHSPCQDANLILHELWLDMATS